MTSNIYHHQYGLEVGWVTTLNIYRQLAWFINSEFRFGLSNPINKMLYLTLEIDKYIIFVTLKYLI